MVLGSGWTVVKQCCAESNVTHHDVGNQIFHGMYYYYSSMPEFRIRIHVTQYPKRQWREFERVCRGAAQCGKRQHNNNRETHQAASVVL